MRTALACAIEAGKRVRKRDGRTALLIRNSLRSHERGELYLGRERY
ncbi:MAG: hypothetical protein HY048_06885 [Acidobacteria bacterium]|nr:hypothetical protein [Acidobacteriota bacterium]